MNENETSIAAYGDIAKDLASHGFGEIRMIVASASKGGVKRMNVRPIILKNRNFWQFEKLINSQAFHENVPEIDFEDMLEKKLAEYRFREINAHAGGKTIHFRITKKGNVRRDEIVNQYAGADGKASAGNNRDAGDADEAAAARNSDVAGDAGEAAAARNSRDAGEAGEAAAVRNSDDAGDADDIASTSKDIYADKAHADSKFGKTHSGFITGMSYDKHANKVHSNNRHAVDLRHDRGKKYILSEGMPILPFVDLGIFDKNYRIVKNKYDKYRQINRFIEIIADDFDDDIERDTHSSGVRNDFACRGDRVIFASRGDRDDFASRGDSAADIHDNEFLILDFGCGKSYLTFFIYYYFTYIRHMDARIVGFDLKKDVVARCNEIAVKYGYSKLKFVVGDVSKINREYADADADGGRGSGRSADMLISLHACDTATDHALYYAISNKIQRIYAVPCCQHEINKQIKSDACLSSILKYGLYKERFSAILTDAVRCEALANMGYAVDVVEFVDFENTPKNAMIRARLKNAANRDNRRSIGSEAEPYNDPCVSKPFAVGDHTKKLLEELNTTHKLIELLNQH